MAQVRSGKTIKVGDNLLLLESVKDVKENTKCKVIDFNEEGNPVLSTCDNRITFVISAFVTAKRLDIA